MELRYHTWLALRLESKLYCWMVSNRLTGNVEHAYFCTRRCAKYNPGDAHGSVAVLSGPIQVILSISSPVHWRGGNENREFGAFTWTPSGCQNWSPTRPSNPGLKSSTPLMENEGFPGPGGLESGPPGPDFEGFRANAEG